MTNQPSQQASQTTTATPPALQMTEVRKVYRMGDTDVVALDHASLTVAASPPRP